MSWFEGKHIPIHIELSQVFEGSIFITLSIFTFTPSFELFIISPKISIISPAFPNVGIVSPGFNWKSKVPVNEVTWVHPPEFIPNKLSISHQIFVAGPFGGLELLHQLW